MVEYSPKILASKEKAIIIIIIITVLDKLHLFMEDQLLPFLWTARNG